jgi:hypothetical protein
MSAMDLAAAEGELYGLPLQEFTAARDAFASEAKRAGELDLARAVKQLRKPSTAAWLGNMLVREHGSDIERLIVLGEKLRSSRNLDGDEIRRATKQKLDAVHKLLRHAEATAARKGQPVSQNVLQDLEVTLDAAFSDPESAASLCAGHLTQTLHYSGLGFGGDGGPRSTSTVDRSLNGTIASIGKAQKALEHAAREAALADAEADKASQAVVTAEADLKRLRAAFAVADRKAKKARQAASAAQKKVDASKGRARR